MKLRLLRFAARHPFMALLMAAGALLTCVAMLCSSSREADGNPRAILGRVWFDELPKKRTDTVEVLIFLAGGIGIHERGSVWRATTDVFDFERQGDKVALTFLQDGVKAETRFKVTPCSDKPPFDMCLDFERSPRGPQRYYGFGDDEDLATRVPWGRAMMRTAESRASAR